VPPTRADDRGALTGNVNCARRRRQLETHRLGRRSPASQTPDLWRNETCAFESTLRCRCEDEPHNSSRDCRDGLRLAHRRRSSDLPELRTLDTALDTRERPSIKRSCCPGWRCRRAAKEDPANALIRSQRPQTHRARARSLFRRRTELATRRRADQHYRRLSQRPIPRRRR
jgi:hypothetical protein